MTVRKLWLIILLLVSVISIVVNAFVMTVLTDRYFGNYLEKNYEKEVGKIIGYTQKALADDNLSFKQMEFELETKLNDPITNIKLFSNKGEILIDVSNNEHLKNNRAKRENRKGHMKKESENYKIISDNDTLGTLQITKYSSPKKSVMANIFKNSLMINSLYSMLIAITIALVIGIYISKKMSRDLIRTAQLAGDIQMGLEDVPEKSSIIEINEIRDSLEELNTRLKIKQKNRKELIDQLLHQTRTPLTILKTHLEAVEDGIIEMNDDEINIWNNEINNITSIITNMSGMIDAGRENDVLEIEKFEISSLINQIAKGIKPQFNKKNIILDIKNNEKIELVTDKHKLSQIIYNLLTNAYKYTDSQGKVEVTYKTENEILFLEVRDNGIGISEDETENIFKAYFRSSQVSKISGDGIGLYIVKENLNLMGGNITVKSSINNGSNFIVELPLKYEKSL